MEKNNRRPKMPFGRTQNLVIQDAEQEMLVYDLDTEKAICLNPTAKFVWKNCDGKTSVSAIAKLLDKEINVELREEIIYLALKELEKENLLEDNSTIKNEEPKIPRRDLIINYGVPLASLPLIMSLVAPVSAQMGSCVALGGTCATAGDCCDAGNSCTTFCCIPNNDLCNPNLAIPNDGCCDINGCSGPGGICGE